MELTPTPILGEITAFTITTPDLALSLAWYQQLGFREVMRADWPFPWIQVTDGVVLIMLRKGNDPYLALTYYVRQIANVVKDLKQKGIAFATEPKKGDPVKRYTFLSPDGLTISLVQMIDGFSQPAGPGMLQMPQADYYQPERYVNKTAGLFGELAHPITDLDATITYWEHLGFKAVSRFSSPYPWAILTDGLSVVGAHQTDNFDYPAITYFAADMARKIAGIRATGISGIADDGNGNAVLTTPEQQRVFLYSLGGREAPAKKQLSDIPQFVLETPRLWLKELNPENVAELYTNYSDEDIITFLGLTTTEQLEKEKDKFRGGLTTFRLSFKNFLMVEKASGRVIGMGGWHTIYTLHHRAELGYALNDDADKGKGYMTEAIAAWLKYGFEVMKLNRMEALVGSENIPSLKLVKRFGFVQEGIMRSHYLRNGIMEDSVIFSLLRDEYFARLSS